MNTTIFEPSEYSTLTYDSREVIPGALFFCKGAAFKKDYLLKAIEKGAKAYVSEEDYHVSIPWIPVDNIRHAMADMADLFYDHAWSAYPLIGLTGSKGKSTTLYFIKSILEEAGKNMAFLSTIDTYDGIDRFESHLTTPEALVLHHHYANARKAKVDAFAMEVSSQALKYDRTRSVVFTIGAFLNFGTDHIGEGEHTDLEDYFQSKLRLMKQCKIALINRDGDRACDIIKAAEESPLCEKIITYSAKEDPFPYDLSIPGSFNIENGLAAVAVAKELGIAEEAIAAGLKKASVPGRMELFENKEKDITCIVDYAHSKLSFERLFESVKDMYPDKNIQILFGCPGGKGLSRRKDLPRAAAPYIDFAWITEEDPGLEDVMAISLEVKAEFDALGIPNTIDICREHAIETAIKTAQRGTVLVLTGKGREEYMHRGNDYPYFEPETSQVERYLNEL